MIMYICMCTCDLMDPLQERVFSLANCLHLPVISIRCFGSAFCYSIEKQQSTKKANTNLTYDRNAKHGCNT
jgi:hypothetical protein